MVTAIAAFCINLLKRVNTRLSKFIQCLPSDCVHQAHRHKRAGCFRFYGPGLKHSIPCFLQAPAQLLFRGRPGFRRCHRFPGHRYGVFPVRYRQPQRFPRHRFEEKIRRDRPALQAFGFFQLVCRCQPVYRVSGSCLCAGSQPEDRRFSGLHIRSGINQVRFLMRSAQCQSVTVLQVFFQSGLRQFSVRRRNFTDPDALVIHAIRENNPRVLTAQRVSVHEAAPVENLEKAFFFLLIRFFKAALFQAVQAFPVTSGNHGHILRPLQPPFQFDGCNPCLLQFRQFIPQAYVPGAEPRAAAAAVIIFHPAGLGAPAPVSAPFPHHAGEKAQAAHRHALCAMGENLNFDTRIRAFADFRQGAFPCQHDAAHPLLFAPDHPGPVVDSHLGACVHSQFGKKLPGNAQHAQVLHQHRVRFQIPQQSQHLCHRFQFAVLDQGIDRHMHTHMPQVGITDRFLQLPAVKITRTGARAESGIPQVYRVCTCRVRPFQSRAVSRRSQVFHVATLPELIHNDGFIIHNYIWLFL